MGKIDIDQEQIRQLAALLEETGLTEIELEDDDRRIRLVRNGAAVAVTAPAPAVAPTIAATAQAAAAAAEAGDDLSGHPGAVTSPMVGTAYRAPEPGAANFVEIGAQVSAGQTLLLIEAMKTFNEIAAPTSGKVTQILFESGTPIEFGDVLMIIE
jgi:acetyl-CoA carboxylase biotin carboxyl carrier protein